MEVYRRPANTFVASFIGTPPMNLFPPGMLDLGRTVGVRPESIAIKPRGGGDPAARGIAAVVDLVESLGSETLVHCITSERSLKVTVRVLGNASIPNVGDAVTLVPDMASSVAFDR